MSGPPAGANPLLLGVAGEQTYGKNLPPSGSDGGRFLHKFDREPHLWRRPLPQLVQMGERSSINSIPNKIHHRMLETRAMVKF